MFSTFAEEKITLSFIVSGVPGLLDHITLDPLESIALEYLTKYVAEVKEEGTFVLDAVSLKSQEPLAIRRRLQSGKRLRVSLSLYGFSIDFANSDLSAMLVDAIDSEGFTKRLQVSHDFFKGVIASSAVREFPRAVEPKQKEEPEPSSETSPATIAVAVLVTMSVVVFVVAAFLLLSRYRNGEQERSIPESSLQSAGGEVESSAPSMSQQSSDFTFSSPVSVLPIDNTKLLGSLSRSIDSGGDSLTLSPINAPKDEIVQEKKKEDERQKVVPGNQTIIPPMIVIDKLEDGEVESKPSVRGKIGIQARLVEASPTLKRAINNELSSPTYSDMLR